MTAHAHATAPAGVGQQVKTAIGQANNVGPLAEMPAQHCATIFLFLFSFKFLKNCINI
jgi:hypothetical protein